MASKSGRYVRDKLGRFASTGGPTGAGGKSGSGVGGSSVGFAKKTGLSSNGGGHTSGYTPAQLKIVRRQLDEHEKTWETVRKHPPGSKQRADFFRKEDSILHQFDSVQPGTGKSKAKESFTETSKRLKTNAQKLASKNAHTQALFAKGIDVSNRSGMSKTQFSKLKAKYKFR